MLLKAVAYVIVKEVMGVFDIIEPTPASTGFWITCLPHCCGTAGILLRLDGAELGL